MQEKIKLDTIFDLLSTYVESLPFKNKLREKGKKKTGGFSW